MAIPKGVITPKEAKALDQAFNSRHKLISDSIVGKPDNRSSWWSLEDMRNYLDTAEKQAKELGYEMNGVRAYLGAHGDKGFTTVFLAPTGNPSSAKDSSVTLKIANGDIPTANPLNDGLDGNPVGTNYPQY